MKGKLSLLPTASLAAGAVCPNACTAKQYEPSETQAVTELKAEMAKVISHFLHAVFHLFILAHFSSTNIPVSFGTPKRVVNRSHLQRKE